MEVVVGATAAPASNLSVWDLASGASVISLKNNTCSRNGLCSVGKNYIAAAQKGKGLVRFWSWEQASTMQESFLSESVGVIASTSDGVYFIGGGRSGSLYVWDTSTAELLRVWPGHYKAVTALAVLDGGSVFVSGGEDAIVNAWALPHVLGDGFVDKSSGSLIPMQSWSEHTLPITSLHSGFGGPNGILVSSSLDCSCNIYQVASGALLKSNKFPVSIMCTTTDQGDHSVYCGGKDGVIYEVSLVGINGDNAWSRLTGHSKSVSCICMSSSGCQLVSGEVNLELEQLSPLISKNKDSFSCLASGSEDGTIRVWDLQTKQCVRVWDSPCRNPVSAILVIPEPPIPTIKQRGQRNSRQSKRSILGLNKYPNTPPKGDLNPWDGSPVPAHGSIEYSGIVSQCGLLVNLRTSTGLQGPMAQEKRLKEANEVAQRLMNVNKRLLEFHKD